MSNQGNEVCVPSNEDLLLVRGIAPVIADITGKQLPALIRVSNWLNAEYNAIVERGNELKKKEEELQQREQKVSEHEIEIREAVRVATKKAEEATKAAHEKMDAADKKSESVARELAQERLRRKNAEEREKELSLKFDSTKHELNMAKSRLGEIDRLKKILIAAENTQG
jgi:exonuclease VII large subunit